MDYDLLMNIVSTIMIPAVGYVVHELSAIKKDLSEFKERVALECVRREDIVRIEQKIDDLRKMMIDRMMEKER